MVFVEQPDISRQIIHKKALVGSVAVIFRGQTSTTYYTPGIGIDNENWLVGRV